MLEKTDLPNEYIRRHAKGNNRALVIWNGLMGDLYDWSDKLNVSRAQLNDRLNNMPIERAMVGNRRILSKKTPKPRIMPSGIPEVTALNL